MVDIIEVKTTIASQEGAQKIAEALVSKRLAACVQISGPIISTYWWQGSMEKAQEWVCTAKTRKDLYPAVEATIRKVHSYDGLEILAIAITTGNHDYVAWVVKETEQIP